MLAFILSKINLLILVMAIFSIVAFFAMGLTDIVKVKAASELAFRVSEKASSLFASSAYCVGDAYELDPALEIAGGEHYYVLKVSVQNVTSASGKALNDLIFSVYPREEIKKAFEDATYVPKSISARDFRSEAQIHLFSRTYDGKDYSGAFAEPVASKREIYADPQAVTPVDTLHMIRQVKEGKTDLYIVACNSAVCIAQLSDVAALAGKKDGFDCQKGKGGSS
ncbi:Uncharacterised protein [uncultured archaeon]|nr:Uncharacterised protein [uncultured archaeon]